MYNSHRAHLRRREAAGTMSIEYAEILSIGVSKRHAYQ